MEKTKKVSFGNYDNHLSVTQNVYTALKESIFSWELKPGTQISESEISEILGVSRTPVRESFIRLRREHLLVIKPQKGTFIARVNLDDVREGVFIRQCIEVPVIKIAVKNFPEDKIKENMHVLELQRQAINDKDYKRFFELDEMFHKNIYYGCNKKKAWELIDNFNFQHKRVRMLILMDTDNFETIYNEHIQIMEGIKDHDEEKVMKNISPHLERLPFEEEMLLAKHPDYFK